MARKITLCFSVLMIYLSFISSMSQGFKLQVIQPETQMINPDKTASIICEHKAQASKVLDVQLYSIQPGGKNEQLCQKGNEPCKDMYLYEESDKKFIFFIVNIDQEKMKIKYQCRFTVEYNSFHYDGRGDTPTTLLEGQYGAPCITDQWTILEFILIGLLALTLLYSFVVTVTFCVCIRQRVKSREHSRDPENSTYVEMRRATTERNPDFDMMCYGRLNDPNSRQIPPRVA